MEAFWLAVPSPTPSCVSSGPHLASLSPQKCQWGWPPTLLSRDPLAGSGRDGWEAGVGAPQALGEGQRGTSITGSSRNLRLWTTQGPLSLQSSGLAGRSGWDCEKGELESSGLEWPEGQVGRPGASHQGNALRAQLAQGWCGHPCSGTTRVRQKESRVCGQSGSCWAVLLPSWAICSLSHPASQSSRPSPGPPQKRGWTCSWPGPPMPLPGLSLGPDLPPEGPGSQAGYQEPQMGLFQGLTEARGQSGGLPARP